MCGHEDGRSAVGSGVGCGREGQRARLATDDRGPRGRDGDVGVCPEQSEETPEEWHPHVQNLRGLLWLPFRGQTAQQEGRSGKACREAIAVLRGRGDVTWRDESSREGCETQRDSEQR